MVMGLIANLRWVRDRSHLTALRVAQPFDRCASLGDCVDQGHSANSEKEGAVRRRSILAGIVVLMACTTTPINTKPDRIPVPPGTTPDEVEAAIVSAIAEKHITPQELTEGLGTNWSNAKRQFAGTWAVENLQDGLVTAGLSVRSHYLQIGVHYDTSAVWVEILGSRNLKQTETHIHRKAYLWIARVEDRIRSELGTYAARAR